MPIITAILMSLMQCMDNVHFNGLFYNTMINANSATVPQCVKSDPNLFKDDVDIRFSKTFNSCKVSSRYEDSLYWFYTGLYWIILVYPLPPV